MTPNTGMIAPWRLATLAVAALVMSGCSQSTPTTEAEVIRPVYVTEAHVGHADGPAFTGEVRAIERAELAFAVSGRVAQVMVEPGEAVRQGQVLAQLDPVPFKAQLASANAELQRGEAQLIEVKQRMDRLRVAQESNAISAAEFSGTQAELGSAESTVRSAKSQQEVAAWSLGQTSLRAPFDGVVATRNVEPGQASGPGVAAISIDGAGRELALLVPDKLSLKAGQAVSLRNGENQLKSKVLRISGRLEAGGVRKVFLTVPEDAAIGSTWAATLSTTDASAAWIPLRAVLPGSAPGSGNVLRLGKNGRTVEQAALKVGSVRGEWIEVMDGLATGDRVVVAGAMAIRPGTVVKPIVMERLETLP